MENNLRIRVGLPSVSPVEWSYVMLTVVT